MKTAPDLNLLVVLDALVSEGSVTKAAQRLNLSIPAASRALGRLRLEFNDEILVRSGRGLTPTAKAIAMHKRVHSLIKEATDLVLIDRPVELSSVQRDFCVAANDAAICYITGPILQMIQKVAPNVRCTFVSEGMRNVSLRDARIDLQLGILHDTEPEVHVEIVLNDRFVGVARAGHPLTKGKVSLDRYLETTHLLHSRHGGLYGTLDERLAKIGRVRHSVSSTPTVASSLFTLLNTDLVSTCLERLSRSVALALGLEYFELPSEITSDGFPAEIGLAWHPKHDADPVHTWFRSCIQQVIGDLQ